MLRRLRARGDRTPVLILTARSEIDDRISGLDLGADDYIIKPIDFRELAARGPCALCAAALAKPRTSSSSAGWSDDRAAKRATLDGVDLELRSRDVHLLEAFLSSLGRVLSKEEVADRIYTFEETPTLNAVEQASSGCGAS